MNIVAYEIIGERSLKWNNTLTTTGTNRTTVLTDQIDVKSADQKYIVIHNLQA